MPGPKARRVQAVVEAVRSGVLAEAALDEAVRRILRIVFMAAETPKGAPFDAAATTRWRARSPAKAWCCSRTTAFCRCKRGGRIAVIGRGAQEPHFQGGGSSHINPTQVDAPFAELEKLAGGAQLTYSEGYPADDSSQPALIADAVAAAQAADVALLYVALPTFKESEGYDRTDLDLTAHQVALIQAVTAAQPRSVVILNNGSAVTMSAWIDGAAACWRRG
jgi:beta-glucosidase